MTYRDSGADNYVHYIGGRFLNWSFARNFGELLILSRASYTMLVAVPILASLWYPIRILVTQFNQSVERSLDQLMLALGLVEQGKDEIASTPNLQLALENLASSISQSQESINALSSIDPNFPLPLIASFFASLFYVLGHLIYQVRCPDLVKQFSTLSYEDYELNRFREHGAPMQVEAARSIVDRIIGVSDPFTRKIPAFRFVSRLRGHEEGNEILSEDELRDVHIDYIIWGARYRYFEASESDSRFATVTALLFIMAAALIIYVVLSQSVAVLAAGGWL